MAEPEGDHLMDHNYDGIQEYDNPMPRWWVWLFWATVVFSAVYIVHYHFGEGLSIHEAYGQEMLAFYDRQASQLAAAGPVTDESLEGLRSNSAMIGGAKLIFAQRCSPCHGVNGEGNIGPNLTDAYWLHGGRPSDIHRVINEGVPAKGMLAWKRQLRPAELMAVAAYVLTLGGTNPPNPKAPQGEKFVAATTPAEAAAGASAPPKTGP